MISRTKQTISFSTNGVQVMRLVIALCLSLQVVTTAIIDNSGTMSGSLCTDEKTEHAEPYLSDSKGEFLSSLQHPAIFSDNLFITLPRTQHLTILELSRRVIYPGSGTLMWTEGNETYSEELSENCLYQGSVRGHLDSSVAVSLCDGLNGYIMTDEEEIMVEKLADGSFHKLVVCKRENDGKRKYEKASRRRRAAPGGRKYMEVLVVADSGTVKLVSNEGVKTYVLTIMNIVNKVYQHDSLTSDIEIITTKIIKMDKNVEKKVVRASDARRTVDNFCRWTTIQSYNNRYYGGGISYDVAVLLTRTVMGPAGYAPITGMCNPSRSCAVVKDEGFTSAFIIAHEVAHVIGLYHDGHGNTCHGAEYATAIMAPMVQANLQHHWWSTCSNDRMNQMIPSLTCLNNNPLTRENAKHVTDPIGDLWSFDQQCQYEFGGRHTACRTFYGDLCAQLWCSDQNGHRLCKTKRGRALEGTSCGADRSCKKGTCTYHGRKDPVNGAWGEWANWGSCSNDCGVGLKLRNRNCDKPTPKFGGRMCTGEDEQLVTCKSEACGSYTDIRGLQCTVLDSLPVRSSRNVWLPYQVDKEDLLCSLTCISNTTGEVATFKDIPMDNGTPCKYDPPYGICMDGKCVAVGCDGVINSTVSEDACGVCGGNGSECKTVKGHFRRKLAYAGRNDVYEQVLVLPKGSRGINVTESKRSAHFLALKDPYYGSYRLNGFGKPGTSKKFVANGAWFIYKNNWNMETLETMGPLRSELKLMVHPQNANEEANYDYSYTVTKDDFTYEKNIVEWKYEGWTDCSVTCGTGVQSLVYGCYILENGTKVDNEMCKYLEDKENEPIKCERLQCSAFTYYWTMSVEWSDCSATCGNEGTQTQMYMCEMRTTDGTGEEVNISMCDGLPHPNYTRECNRVPCVPDIYEWILYNWSDCSATCGNDGVQVATVECIRLTPDNSTEVVEVGLCINETEPNNTIACPPQESCIEYTYQWVLSDWSGCSASCGEGVERVWYVCERQSDGSFESVSGKFCVNLPSPNSTRPCAVQPCYQYQWTANQWSECSATCGDDGVLEAMIVCEQVSPDNESVTITVNSQFCNNIPRPKSTKICNRIPCVSLQWVVNSTECSDSCGEHGVLDTVYACQKVNGNDTFIEYVDDEVCYGKERPEVDTACNRFPCPVQTYMWKIFDWAQCTHSCGFEGIRIPILNCQTSDAEEVDPVLCGPVTSPPASLECNRLPCLMEWQSSEWSQCSVSCGRGTRTRNVFCTNPQPETDDISNCSGDRPGTEESCNSRPCSRGRRCVQDRIRVCRRRASRAKCSYAGYRKMCCKTCQRYIRLG
ncbi:A disintegrin and metalloproteinase with thrombospondin motifs 10-like [Mizuhopecten yessoensis]|uniref:A disintegrin and metalloproteinase with thrombospondin motifs 3 n=1 Tax=Mizuhopecten yessoensis TaxID=6573 RepID=A0A210PLY5_MIZYE|nr:A disintegrin and metalloproteinase with thrombospondin motifs 10-like [Mizuhopecten yessoensis]OWF37495.1 A disintegrin and metalloproteinase with thrombospondin motifs 3 [Mizuhopecten yessoensis]